MPANPLSAQPAATSKPELTPTHPPFMSPGCVFPICFCVFQCRYCSSRGQGTDRLEAIFWDQFLLFVDFRATRHGHNCESGPHSWDRTVSICSDQTDDLLSTNQNVFGQISVFAQQKVFGDQFSKLMGPGPSPSPSPSQRSPQMSNSKIRLKIVLNVQFS